MKIKKNVPNLCERFNQKSKDSASIRIMGPCYEKQQKKLGIAEGVEI